MISADDIMSRSRTKAIAVGTAIAGPCRVFGMGVSAGGAQGGIQIFDSAATSGDFIQVNSVGNNAESYKWEPCGIRFSTGLSIGATGAAVDSLYVLYVEE